MNEIIQSAHLSVVVRNDGEINTYLLRFIDIIDPSSMTVQSINAQRQHLNIALGKFIFQGCCFSKFGCTDRCIVGGMRKQNAPGITEIIVEVNFASGCSGLEVGSDVP